MESASNPLASLVTATPSALSVRPTIGSRSMSARSLPSSTHPRVSLAVSLQRVPEELIAGVRELAKHAVRGNVSVFDTDDELRSARAAFVWVVRFRKDASFGRKLAISCSHDDFTNVPPGAMFEIEIVYNRPIEGFRGWGHVLAISRGLATFKHPDAPDTEEDAMDEGSQSGADPGVEWSGAVGKDLKREEDCLFETVGVLLDNSRNAVMKVDAVKFLLRQLAMSGTNVLQLYCEETYKIPGEPFFGYFRGPYSEEELKAIDDYAFDLGIEVIACIQTLGHLGQMLQWGAYASLRDTQEVIIADAVQTYQFIEKMIKAVAGPLRTKRIHIGMDEAHGVSEGRYRQYFGYKDSTKVFTDHLHRVNDICVKAGLAPMLWSDMLFCLPAKNNALSSYYDTSTDLPEDLPASMPENVDLVFWNYYQTSSVPYEQKIKQHWQLAGRAPWVASGVWTWSRFWTALPFTFATIKAAMIAAKKPELGVTNVMTTIWGDEGNEFDFYSSIPGIFYHAELAYTKNDEVDTPLLRKRFDGITGGDFDDYVYASKLDDTQPESQPIDVRTHYTPNIAKYLLWEQPFYAILSPQYQGFDLESHYSHIAEYLDQAGSEDFSTMNTISLPHSVRDFPANKRLRIPALLARVLSLKCHLRERLVRAYEGKDEVELTALAAEGPESRMSRLRVLVEQLHQLHRKHWHSVYKPFGWEVLDLRYGGLRAQLETMHQRLIAYLDPEDDSVTRVEELEVKNEIVYPGQGPNLLLDWQRASRPQYV